MQMVAPGTRLGPYQVLELLGTGGMGEVYRATDLRLGRLVAVKVLSANSASRPDLRMRFRNEARVIASLNHPHICTLYDLGSLDDLEYFIMEYIEGQTLATVLKAGRVPVLVALRYAREIAEALVAAHAAGVLHRDLKPSNVMITPQGRVKVLDFGIAKRMIEADGDETRSLGLTGAGAIVGTLPYLAPEVLQGRPADVRSDIWAFGATLHEVATGAALFQGQAPLEIISAILHGPSRPLPAAFPKCFRTALRQCLERDPAERFQNAADLRAALRTAQKEVDPSGLSPRQRVLRDGAERSRERNSSRVSTGAPGSQDPEANEYFEKGILFIWARPDLPRAREMLEKALTLDTDFAEARAAYGFTDWMMIEQGYSSDTTWLYEAEERLYQAVQANANSALAHYGLAAVYLYQGRKELVPAEVDKALKAKPGRPTALHWLAHYHRLNGNYDAALELWKQLIERDPLFWPARMNYGDVLLQQGEPGKALREQEKFLEQAPDNIFAIRCLSRAYMSLNELSRAHTILDQVKADDVGNYHIRMSRILLAALEGRHDDAQGAMDDDLLQFAGAHAVRTFEAVELYSVLGQKAKALEWLDRTVRNGDERFDWFQRDPLLASIHDDPRFKRILESVAHRRKQSDHTK